MSFLPEPENIMLVVLPIRYISFIFSCGLCDLLLFITDLSHIMYDMFQDLWDSLALDVLQQASGTLLIL